MKLLVLAGLLFSHISWGFSLQITSPTTNSFNSIRSAKYSVYDSSVTLDLLGSGTSSEVGGTLKCNGLNGSATSSVVISPTTTNESWRAIVPVALGANRILCEYQKGTLIYSTNIMVNRMSSTTILDFWANITHSQKGIRLEAINLNPGKTALSYHWDYGYSNLGNQMQETMTGEEIETTHVFPNFGVYTITLTATFDDNSTETISKNLEIKDPINLDPIADFDFIRFDLPPII